MGGKNSLPIRENREKWSSVLHDMVNKYGLGALDCLDDWNKMGFPEQGSLSVKKLLELDSQLKTAEKKIRQKKKIKTCKLEKCDLHRRVFSLWMQEAQYRLRKSEMEELPNTDSLMEETMPHAPPAYVLSSRYSHNSSLYPQAPQIDLESDSQPMPASQPPVPPIQPVLPTPPLALIPNKHPQDNQPLHQQTSLHSVPTCTLISAVLSLLGEAQRREGLTVQKTLPPQPSTPNHDGEAETRRRDVAITQDNTPPYGRSEPVTRAQGTPRVYHQADNLPNPNEENVPRAAMQCPMVEATDPRGDIMMLQRFWSPEEISQYAATLKKPAIVGGRRWTDQLQAFCRTYRPTMREVLDICAKNMGPSEMQTVLDAARAYQNERPVFAHFEDNHRYIDAVDTVCETILILFPTILNLAEVHACKQGRDETVSQFRHRLEEAIQVHGGGKDQNDPFAKAFLASQLLNNMRKEISNRVKESLIGYKAADPTEIIKHATHAEEVENDATEKEKKQKKEKSEMLQLAMMEAVTKLSTDKEEHDNETDDNRCGRNQYDDHLPDDDYCCNYGSPDHRETRRDYYDENGHGYRSSERGERRDIGYYGEEEFEH